MDKHSDIISHIWIFDCLSKKIYAYLIISIEKFIDNVLNYWLGAYPAPQSVKSGLIFPSFPCML